LDYCLEQQLDTQCASDEIITVDTARYGRMRLNRCVHTDYGFIGCGTDVTDVLAGHCAGRHRCQVVNIEALFAASRVCPTDLKSYLEASFTCVKGRTFRHHTLVAGFVYLVRRGAGRWAYHAQLGQFH